MIRRPPRSTRTDTLFPYTTLCRSDLRLRVQRIAVLVDRIEQCHVHGVEHAERHRGIERARMQQTLRMAERVRIAHEIDVRRLALNPGAQVRSEERRGGKECVGTGSSGWWPYL